MANGYAKYSGIGGGSGGGVTSLNSLTGALTLVAGSGISITPSGSNITIAATNSGTVTNVTATSPLFSSGGATPNLTIQVANTSQNGYLSSTDWNTFNGKQAAGNYLTALTGDATASGPGSAALTLATVNSNVGSFTNANITVNAKGLITAASNGSAGTGTVTSVALTAPASILSVSGSPVTTSGTLALSLANQSANLVWAGPTSGGSAAPTFRALVNADLPSGTSAFARYASNQVTTISSVISSTSFTTYSNSPAFSFTPTITGTYKVYCNIPTQTSNSSSQSVSRIFNTTGAATLLQESQATDFSSSGSVVGDNFVQSFYTLTAGVTYVFDIQAKDPGATGVQNRGDVAPFYMFAEGIGLATASFTAMAAFGSSPNANGGTISGNTLTLQPADATNPGGVSTASQTFAGSKNFTSPIGYNNTTPAAGTALDIINTTGSTQRIIQTGYAGSVGLRGRYANGSIGSPTAATSGNNLSFISGMGYGATGFPANSTAAVSIKAEGTFTDSSMPTSVTISTTPSGSITAVDALKVLATGQITGPAFYTAAGTLYTDASGNFTATTASGSSFLTGSTTYTTPSNITSATRFKFTLVGAGAAGGGNPVTINTSGSGGGAGGVAIVYLTGLTASTAYTYAIGTGGTGVTNSTGNVGGNTSITINATTYTAAGGSGGAPGPSVAGGAGGSTTNATIGITGQNGLAVGPAATAVPGAMGGAATGWGTGGQGPLHPGTGSTVGNPGVGFGAGGSGSAAGNASGTTNAGGAGANGCILVEWYN